MQVSSGTLFWCRCLLLCNRKVLLHKNTPWDAHYCVHYYTKFGITSLSVIYVARRCICCLSNRARRESLQSKLFVLFKVIVYFNSSHITPNIARQPEVAQKKPQIYRQKNLILVILISGEILAVACAT